ncbi:hypothetical protein GCM10028791_39480 [Echinicola sediminis]
MTTESKIKAWKDTIDQSTQAFISTFGQLTEDQLHAKPNATTWSIAENIQHLIVINQSYFPIFQQLVDGKYEKPFMGNISFLTKALGNMILKSVSPENPKKLKTIPIWSPNKYQPLQKENGLLSAFEAHQILLKEWIDKLMPFLEKNQIIHSPANRLIAYRLDTALDIITTHEMRHFEQAKRLL